ncbi:MAG: hypothetical protein WB696_19130 [Chthoniobacterales bacterium]
MSILFLLEGVMSLFPSWQGRNPTPPGLRRGGGRIAAADLPKAGSACPGVRFALQCRQ